MVRRYLVLHEGTKETAYVNLPGSNLYVSSEGTLYMYSERVPKKNRKGYYVLRQGTKKYYSKETLANLYKKFLDEPPKK